LTTHQFVYDDWNVVLVLNGRDLNEDEQPDNTVVRKCTWGLDLSGTVHAAGGVGGLLAAVETVGANQGSYWYFYDGNGNVVQVLKYTAGSPPTVTLAAHYEYDPYGNILLKNDVDSSGLVNANPFRFSTKWLDTELASPNAKGAVGPDGMYYYGYRFYSPRLGRWINRDPLEEEGGLLLYGFVGNQPIGSIDPDGRAEVKVEWHHLLPEQFAEKFRNAGISDDLRLSKDYGWEMPWQSHRGEAGLHPDWNKEWKEFFDDFEKRGQKPSRMNVEKKLKDMMNNQKFAENLNKGNKARFSYAQWRKIKDAAVKKGVKAAGKRGVVKFLKKLGKRVPVVGIVVCGAGTIWEKGWIRGTADIATDQLPVVGWVKFVYEMLSGEDVIPPPDGD
jgi:RHS repeat-associated protein